MNPKSAIINLSKTKIFSPLIWIRAVFALLTLGIAVSISPAPVAQETAPAPQQLTPLEGKQKVLLLGDSITQAGGNYGGYVWLMRAYLNALYPQSQLELISAGVSGQTSANLRQRFEGDVLDKKPDLVTINVGVNDVLQSFRTAVNESENGSNIETYRENITAMVKAAQARNITVVLLSPTIIGEDLNSRENIRLREYIAVMRAVAEQNRCRFLDLNLPFRDVILTYQRYGGQAKNINVLTRDGIHPNLAGHQILAYTILKSWGVPEEPIKKLEVIE